ncbi:lmo0954 family membrane protein [Bacillus norwichensis]|uniref:Flagellar basal body rod protein n=1 Tax=Bacillus norwichensis TaxID=2762217 RepID=A0ABR8VRQ9_9BACI|nr:flagellar basal body rod protein [Bacillus norwichensis]MBD8007402.1 flagellar basal body rod protein [Bacillus norwichensis]
MKNVLVFTLAVILAIIAIASLGNIVGMAICLIIVYYSLKQFLKTHSTWQKIAWGLLGIIGLTGLLGNLPALAGIAAVYVLYVGYKNWKKEEAEEIEVEQDPFVNFERQWKDLEKGHTKN